MFRTAWQKALLHAEQVVGYPAPFFNLRYLLSDELSIVAGQMRKLVGTRHPLLQTVRDLIGSRKSLAQTRGLLVLLLARSVSAASLTPLSGGGAGGVIPGQQRSLAEIAETVHTAMAIHSGVVDLEVHEPGSQIRLDLEFGNKMATLSGDFLLAWVSTALAELHNTRVVEDVSVGISDMVQAEFSLLASSPLPLAPAPSTFSPLTQTDWEHYIHLSRGSILSRCSASAALLTEAGQEMQLAVGTFARDWTRLYQLTEEMRALRTNQWSKDIPGLPHILAGGDLGGGNWKARSQEALAEYAQASRESLAALPAENEATQVLGEMVTAVCQEV